MKTKRKSATAILGQTWGWDIADVRECEYQPGHTGGERLYSLGNDYYCVQQKAPKYGVKDDEIAWAPYSDQQIAARYSTVIWKGVLIPG